jgi:hypothetical protein
VSGVQDHIHPAEKDLDFNNQVIEVIYHEDCAYFNVMMTNGNNGKINCPTKKEIKMEKKFIDEPVAKIWYFKRPKRITCLDSSFYPKRVMSCCRWESFHNHKLSYY